MTVTEIIKKVRELEIKSKRLTNHLFSGEYHTAFKGKGMAFKEVREYQAGDDIRFIEWNVSARMGNTYSKVFEEERELSVYLLIDISASSFFGTNIQTKKELATEIAAGHTVGSLHGLRQGAGDGADDGDGEKDGNRNGEHASDQHIPLQRSGGSFGPLTCFDRGLGLKLNLFVDRSLVGPLCRAVLLFQELGGFVPLTLLDHRQILIPQLHEIGTPLLHAREEFLAFFRGD